MRLNQQISFLFLYFSFTTIQCRQNQKKIISLYSVNWAFFSKVTFQPLTQAAPHSSVELSYLLAKANWLQIIVHLVAFFDGGHQNGMSLFLCISMESLIFFMFIDRIIIYYAIFRWTKKKYTTYSNPMEIIVTNPERTIKHNEIKQNIEQKIPIKFVNVFMRNCSNQSTSYKTINFKQRNRDNFKHETTTTLYALRVLQTLGKKNVTNYNHWIRWTIEKKNVRRLDVCMRSPGVSKSDRVFWTTICVFSLHWTFAVFLYILPAQSASFLNYHCRSRIDICFFNDPTVILQ